LCSAYTKKQWTANHAFATWSQVPVTVEKSDITRLLLGIFDSKLRGGVVVREVHADGGIHFHAAVFGDIPKRGSVFSSFNTKSSGWPCASGVHLPVGGNHLQFSHGKPKNLPWPFLGENSMVEYLTKSTPKKTVDPDPLFFTVDLLDLSDIEQVDIDAMCDSYRTAYPAPVGLMGRAALVEEMAEAGVPTSEVIKAIMVDTTKDNAHEFAMLIQLFNATARISDPVELAEFEPRPWQKMVLDWMTMPLDKMDNNHRGLWMHCPPGSGKSTLITMLKSLVGVDSVFIPAERTETYNTQSMNEYAGQRIIALDDTRGYTNDTGSTIHKASFIKFIKAIASGDDMVYTMYNKVFRYQPVARILITSNYPMPVVNEEDENIALRRRYIELKSIEVDQVAKDLGLPRNLAARDGELVGVVAPVHPPPNFGAQMPLGDALEDPICIDLRTPPSSPRELNAPPVGLSDSGNPRARTRARVNYSELSEDEEEGVEECKESQMDI